jgi:hypothetical protein
MLGTHQACCLCLSRPFARQAAPLQPGVCEAARQGWGRSRLQRRGEPAVALSESSSPSHPTAAAAATVAPHVLGWRWHIDSALAAAWRQAPPPLRGGLGVVIRRDFHRGFERCSRRGRSSVAPTGGAATPVRPAAAAAACSASASVGRRRRRRNTTTTGRAHTRDRESPASASS